MKRLVFLVGLSGSGKSTVGRLLAGRLQLPFIDIDAEIERRAGRSIPVLFHEEGEPAFRLRERELIAEVCARSSGVVATGGGAPVDPDNREAMRQAGAVLWLDAPSEVLAARVGSTAPSRPLLRGDAAAALESLREARLEAYAASGPRIDTGGRSPTEVVEHAAQLLRTVYGPFARSAESGPSDPLWVHTSAHSYPIYLGTGLLRRLPNLLDDHGLGGRLLVLVDEIVDGLYHEELVGALGDRARVWRPIPAGEEHKTLEHAYQLYDALLGERPERADVLVAIGGGVVGDLAGLIAATLLRGVRFVQVPTTVLSQVDSSVGGKVGVDHPRGKNLIGAFYQPNLVAADLDLLHTLPSRQVAAGLAEVVKIAVAQDASLFDQLEEDALRLRDLDLEVVESAVRRAIELKAALVEQDERDLLGIRALLNYGHTIGHALEAATGYERYLHGEAVAIGMTAAARIANWMGLHPEDAVARQDQLLEALGLPLRAAGVARAAIQEGIGLDKKRSAGKIEWVLPTGLGSTRSGVEVANQLVERGIDAILADEGS